MLEKMKNKLSKKMMAYGLVAVLGLGAVGGVAVSLQDVNKDTGAYSSQTFNNKTYVTTQALNLRATASTKGKVLKVIPKGTQITASVKYGPWYKTSYQGKTGYVSGAYLKSVTYPKRTNPTIYSGTPKKMTLAETKAHIKGKLSYKPSVGYYAYDVTGRGNVWVALTTNKSGPMVISVRPDFFESLKVNKAEYIEFLGKGDYEILQKQIVKGKSALRASVETLVGKNKSISDRVYNEVFIASKTGKDKTLTFGGKKVRITEHKGIVNVLY